MKRAAPLLLSSWIVAVIMVSAPALMAGAPKNTPPAPLPAQITTARKVFISNAGEDPHFKQLGLHRSYDQFYAAMKDWGRYELVTSPSEADTVFEISLASQIEKYGHEQETVPFLRLAILDPKTRITLWEFTEDLETGGIVIVGLHLDAKFDKAMARMVEDVKGLVQPPPSPPPAKP
jgi:hypothetical protein